MGEAVFQGGGFRREAAPFARGALPGTGRGACPADAFAGRERAEEKGGSGVADAAKEKGDAKGGLSGRADLRGEGEGRSAAAPPRKR